MKNLEKESEEKGIKKNWKDRAEPVSEWKFDGNAGDSKGNNHGTLKGNPAWAPDRWGNPGKALSLDGVDDYVDCGNDKSLSFGNGTKDRPFSIEAWVKMNNRSNFQIAYKVNEYKLINNNNFRLYLYDGDTSNTIYKSGGDLRAYEGQWIHLVVTYDGSGSTNGINLYKDGVLQDSREGSSGTYVAMENKEGSFYIGSSNTDGFIDDVRIYNHPLSPEEVKAVYNSHTPLKVEVLRPHYRNAIFSGQRVKNIELEVITGMFPEKRQNYIFEFSLKSDKEILCHRTKIKGEKTIVSVRLPPLKVGDYQMQGSLVHQPTGKVIAKWQDVLSKLAPRKGEVRFDKNMVCLIDNEPFLPFGVANRWQYGGIYEAVEIGCNAVEHFNVFRAKDTDIDVDEYFNELDQYGLKLIVYPYPTGFPVPIMDREDFTKLLTQTQEDTLRSHIQRKKDDPAILAWYTGNEPQPPEVNRNTMKQIDKIIREEDPYHPTLIAIHRIGNIGYYADATAVLWPDPYPGFIKDGGWEHPQRPTKSVEESVKASSGRKPVWVFLQAHDKTIFGSLNHRAPSFVDLRNQMYQAAVAGAKGFFWYCRYWIEPQVKIGLTYLARESQLLREAIFAPKSPHKFIAVKDSGKYPEDLHLSRREVGKDFYLFAVSSSDKRRKTRFNTGKTRNKKLFVVGECREVELQKGEFSDSFEPYDTHIYTTNKSIARQLDIACVFKEIDVTCSPVIKPGNLAHESRGTTVKVSCRDTNESPLKHPPINSIIDGIKASSWRGSPELPSGVEITFAKPEKICRAVIDSNICHLQIEVEKDGTWVRVADEEIDMKMPRREVQTVKFPLVETKRLLLRSLAVKDGKVVGGKGTQIWEIEVYGED